jgi:hypothetical protein
MAFFKANLTTKIFADCNGMLINKWLFDFDHVRVLHFAI